MSKSRSAAGVSLLSQLATLSREVQLASDAYAKLEVSMTRTQALLKKCELLEHNYSSEAVHILDSASTSPSPERELIKLRSMATAFNVQYLKLQLQMQRENQVFTSVSNVLKTRHDTIKNSIGSIK